MDYLLSDITPSTLQVISQLIVPHTITSSHLDGTNTVFGRVIDGMDALEALERIPVDKQNRPLQHIKINKVKIHANPIADGTVF